MGTALHPAGEGGGAEVLTDLCEINRHPETFREEFSDFGGGGRWYLAVKQQSTANKMNYFLISFCVMGTAQKKLLLMYNSSEYIN